MSDLGAYQDEMAPRYGLTDEQIERLVTGGIVEEAHSDLAMFLADVKAQGRVDEATASRHLAALSHEAERPSAQGVPPRLQQSNVQLDRLWRRVMRRGIRLVAQASAAVVVLSGSMIGLAYAGVDLPGTAAENALEAVTSVELPNQTDEPTSTENGNSVSEDVKGVHETMTERGCEFGQAVSEAAGQNRRGEGGSGVDPCTRGDEKEKPENEPQGSKATGEERSAEGRATAAEKSEGRSEAGGDNAGTKNDHGEMTSDGAPSKKDEGVTEAGPPADVPGTNNDQGQATAEEAKGERGQADAAGQRKP